MPSAYIRGLNSDLDDPLAIGQPPCPDLGERFIAWYASLPEISRHRPFAMSELETALTTQGKYLSPILLSLGWQRRRKWSSKGQYHRYWVPSSRLHEA